MRRRGVTMLSMAVLLGLVLLSGVAVAGSTPVKMWVLGAVKDEDVAYMDAAVAKFRAQSGLDVTYEFVGWGDAFQKISTAIAAGEGPDVTQVGTTWVATFQATGGFADLTEYVGKEIPSADAFTPGAWATTGYGGKVYSVPWFSDIRAMMYRTDLWGEAGYPEGPQTWDEFREGAKKIKDAHPELDSVIGLQGQGVAHWVGSFIWQNCGEFFSEDGTTATWNDPKNIEAMQWWTDMLVKDGTISKMTSEWGFVEPITRFWDGKVALILLGSPHISLGTTPEQIEKMQDKVGITPEPAGKNGCRHGFVGGSNVMLFEHSTNKENALKWMAFLLQPEIQELRAQVRHEGPVIKAAYDLPTFKQWWWPHFFEAAQNGRHFPVHPAWGEMESLMGKWKTEIYTSVIDGTYTDTTVKEIGEAVNAEAQEKIDLVGAPENYHVPWPQPK